MRNGNNINEEPQGDDEDKAAAQKQQQQQQQQQQQLQQQLQQQQQPQLNQNDALASEPPSPLSQVRKVREVAPPGRAMVRTRMPDAPGGMGFSIRPLPREACGPRIPADTEDTWDAPQQQEESTEKSSDER